MRLNILVILGILVVAAQVSAGEQPVLKTDKDLVNYGIGVNIVRSFQQQGIEIEPDVVMRGMKDALSGGKLLMSEMELRKTINEYQNEIRRKRKYAVAMEAQNNKRSGDAFLAGNGKKKDVVTLPSGLQYEILKAGNGKRAKDADKVECNYRGTHINGTEFVNTFATNSPVILNVEEGAGIPGLSEALKLMPAGSTWRLFIPPQLAYAERGHGREIGPNEVLIIEVELLAIQ